MYEKHYKTLVGDAKYMKNEEQEGAEVIKEKRTRKRASRQWDFVGGLGVTWKDAYVIPDNLHEYW
jgi:hypothetical protein